MKKKKILMIIPTLSNGGAERVVSNLSMGLGKEYNIDILLDYDNVGYDYCGNIIKCLPNVTEEPKGFLKIFMNLKKYIKLRQMKKRHQYEVYISHSRLSNFLNALSGSNNCKTVATVHSSVARKLSNEKGIKIRFWFGIEKFSYHNVTEVVAVSYGVANEIKKYYRVPEKKVSAIWNGTDVTKINRLSTEALQEEQVAWFSESGETIVSVGRYTTPKAHWHLIRAFADVLKDFPYAKLIILGEGELRTYYESLINTLHIEKNVVLSGFLQNPFSIIRKSTVFVMSSLWEGMPCTLVEAMCCRIPCVITDFKSSAREILQISQKARFSSQGYLVGEYGILTPICSGKEYSGSEPLEEGEIALAEGIKKFFSDSDLAKEIVNNNEKRLQDFSIEEMIEKWKRVIEK